MLDAAFDQLPCGQSLDDTVAVLKQDLPTLFQQDLDYSIYAGNIVFQDPLSQFSGKFAYRLIFWTLRFHAALFFKEIYFDLHNIRPDEVDTICAEWTVRGVLRLPWHRAVCFHGYSVYRLNKEGLICEHVDIWDRPPVQILNQMLLGT
jgi:hypothetical protein